MKPTATAAVYRPQLLPHYRGNPLIEALPDILAPDEAARALQRGVEASAEELALPGHLRRHAAMRLRDFMQPLTDHVELAARMGELVRDGYVARDPLAPEWATRLREGAAKAALAAGGEGGGAGGSRPRPPDVPGLGMAVVGPSGVGKTTAVNAVLRSYPQVIRHRVYAGKRLPVVSQIVWLRLTCPPDGSTRELGLAFLDAVDALVGTEYARHYVNRRSTAEGVRRLMAHVAAVHGLGVLVIDEIQCLSEARSGGWKVMLNFLLALMNDLRVPIVPVGTPKCTRVLGAEWQQARRGAGMGDFFIDRLPNDEEFALFCRSLWEGQFLRRPEAITREMVDLLHDLSQGVVDLVVKLFTLAQKRALDEGAETLTADHLKAVHRESFRLVHRFLDDMRRGKRTDDDRWDDALRLLGAGLGTPAVGAAAAPAPAERGAAEDGRAAPKGAGPGPRKRKAQEEDPAADHPCELVRIVREGKTGGADAHAALVRAGQVHDLGAEVLGS